MFRWVYFQDFKTSYPKERSGKREKNLKLKVSVSEKKIRLPILKLDFGFPIPKPGFGGKLHSGDHCLSLLELGESAKFLENSKPMYISTRYV